jgi:hypothetical protein
MGQKKVSIISGTYISEVSLFQGSKLFLVKEKVSLLERCPHFRLVSLERGSTVYITVKVSQAVYKWSLGS